MIKDLNSLAIIGSSLLDKRLKSAGSLMVASKFLDIVKGKMIYQLVELMIW
jgi:hypothetical protein